MDGFMCVCMYVGRHVCVSVCLSVCMYVCMYVRLYACMRAWMYVCMYVRLHIRFRICIRIRLRMCLGIGIGIYIYTRENLCPCTDVTTLLSTRECRVLGSHLDANSTPWCLVGNGGMDPCSSPYIIIPSNRPQHPFPHSLLRTRQVSAGGTMVRVHGQHFRPHGQDRDRVVQRFALLRYNCLSYF